MSPLRPRFTLAPGLPVCLLSAICCVPVAPAWAVLPDEIQVYDDSIDDRGGHGLELHVNATPAGRAQPDYPGEVTPVHGVRTTLEPSYGLTDTLELGAYLPFDHLPSGAERFAGPRIRLKFIPQRSSADDPAFYGINFELSHVKAIFEEAQDVLEVRPILGYRRDGWLLAFNPALDFALKPGQRAGGPDLAPGLKLSREAVTGIAVGAEYYADLGKVSQILPYAQQSHTLFATLDVDRKPWVFNVGIGRGLTSPADRWTVKAIVELPI